jgi:hypothetical protein
MSGLATVTGKRAKRALRSLALSQGRLRGFARLAQISFGKLRAGSHGAKNAGSE